MSIFQGLGAWLDRYDPETSRLLQALRPNFAVVGDGAWNHIPEIQADMAPDPLIILRHVNSDISWEPIDLASIFRYRADRYGGRFAAYGLNEPSVDSREARLKVVRWELEFIAECHKLGLPTVCLNLATGNPSGKSKIPEIEQVEMQEAMEELRPIHDASEYIGLHLYHLTPNEGQSFLGLLYTAYRYRLWPNWFRRDKLLCTEMGIDGAYMRFGWRQIGESNTLAALSALASEWKQDGILGGAFFHLGTMSDEWDKYLMNESLAKALSVHNEGYASVPESNIGEEPTMSEPQFRLGFKDLADRLQTEGHTVTAVNDEISINHASLQRVEIDGKPNLFAWLDGEDSVVVYPLA